MVHPMAGVGDFDQAPIRDGLIARVIFGDGEKAFQAPEKEDRAGDLAEDLDSIFHVVAIGRDGARVVIEFPEQGAVGFPVGSVQG